MYSNKTWMWLLQLGGESCSLAEAAEHWLSKHVAQACLYPTRMYVTEINSFHIFEDYGFKMSFEYFIKYWA